MGSMYGPDVTFLGVERADLEVPGSWRDADAVIVGAPFDGGTSHRPGTRFGPLAIRSTDYLPHDASRPHLALRIDPLQDLRIVDVGDVEMLSGETQTASAATADVLVDERSGGRGRAGTG
jgi:agmatinase